jgi:hypothetical protein
VKLNNSYLPAGLQRPRRGRAGGSKSGHSGCDYSSVAARMPADALNARAIASATDSSPAPPVPALVLMLEWMGMEADARTGRGVDGAVRVASTSVVLTHALGVLPPAVTTGALPSATCWEVGPTGTGARAGGVL